MANGIVLTDLTILAVTADTGMLVTLITIANITINVMGQSIAATSTNTTGNAVTACHPACLPAHLHARVPVWLRDCLRMRNDLHAYTPSCLYAYTRPPTVPSPTKHNLAYPVLSCPALPYRTPPHPTLPNLT